MKKSTLRTLALLLALLMLFSLVSCSGDDDGKGDTPVLHEAYVNALSAPAASAEMTSKLHVTPTPLEAAYQVTYLNGRAEVLYTRSRFTTVAPDTGKIETETGIMYIEKDGSTAGEIGVLAKALITRRISLSGVTEYDDTDNTLTFTVKAADSVSVFGGECEYDVTVSIFLKDGSVEKITVSYVSDSGNVTAECNYVC